MKEEHWDEGEDGAKEFFDSVGALQHHELDEQAEKRLRKQRITELRRRAEERLDWKRISGDFDFDFEASEEGEAERDA